MEYDDQVKQELDKVPVFRRALAEKALEDFARSKGSRRITVAVFEEARAKFFGSKG